MAELRNLIAGHQLRLGVCISRDDMEVEMSQVQGYLNAIRDEAVQREIRIMRAIEKFDAHMREESRMVRKDVASIHSRIDTFQQWQSNNRRPRAPG